MYSSVTTHWLPRVISGFLEDHPGIGYELMFYFTLPEDIRRAVAQLPERKVKHYVDVIARMRDDGLVTPLAVCWGDGRVFQIEAVLRPSPVTLPPKGKDDPVLSLPGSTSNETSPCPTCPRNGT